MDRGWNHMSQHPTIRFAKPKPKSWPGVYGAWFLQGFVFEDAMGVHACWLRWLEASIGVI
jgi:hypothetical protein